MRRIENNIRFFGTSLLKCRSYEDVVSYLASDGCLHAAIGICHVRLEDEDEIFEWIDQNEPKLFELMLQYVKNHMSDYPQIIAYIERVTEEGF